MRTPILLIGFNRPEIIIQAFNCIAEEKPEKLFIAIDGPRENSPSDINLVSEVKRIVKNITWPCEAHYLFNNDNKGAEITVSNSVSWALEEEDSVIVIEDDIITSRSFFQFCEEMLLLYKYEEKIYMVSGGQFTPVELPGQEDYLFAIHGHTGTGWATWKRAWKHFDLFMDVDKRQIKIRQIRNKINCKEEEYYIMDSIMELRGNGVGGNTWDQCWLFIRFDEQGLSVIPRVNLTSNIGVYGLHTTGKTEHHYRPFDKEFVAKVHPAIVVCNRKYDAIHAKTYLFRRNMIMERIRRSKVYKTLRYAKIKMYNGMIR
jgi:hypothetical protein